MLMPRSVGTVNRENNIVTPYNLVHIDAGTIHTRPRYRGPDSLEWMLKR